MNKKTYTAILDAVAREHVSDQVNLAPRILARIQTRKGSIMRPRAKMLIATVVTLLVLAVVLTRVPAVAEAMQRLFSRFIPGIGLVDMATTRILAEPVSVTRKGITVTVNQLVADSEHTVLIYMVYAVGGQPAGPIQSPTREHDCMERPRLRLPNGTELTHPQGSSFSGGLTGGIGFYANYHYASIPLEVSDLTFVLPCLEHVDRRRAVPENWEIPLRLVLAPPDMTTYPVIEVVPTSPGVPPITPAASAYTFSLSIDRVVPMDKRYRLYGTLTGSNNSLHLLYADQIHLLDANGNEIPGMSEQTGIISPGWLPVVFEANAVYVPGPVTLVVESAVADIPLAAARDNWPSFTIDVGEHPQIGQVWKIDKGFMISGYPLHIVSARFIEHRGEYGFHFEMTSPNVNVHGAWLTDLERPRGQYGVASFGFDGKPLYTEMSYEPGFMPSDLVTIHIPGITVALNGPWQTTITLPAIAKTPSP